MKRHFKPGIRSFVLIDFRGDGGNEMSVNGMTIIALDSYQKKTSEKF